MIFSHDFFSDLDSLDLDAWQIKDERLINKGTGREYSYDTSKQGYDLDGMIIEERYIEDYLNTAQDKWKFCQEDNETFKIKCRTSGSFLRDEFTGNQSIILAQNPKAYFCKNWGEK